MKYPHRHTLWCAVCGETSEMLCRRPAEWAESGWTCPEAVRIDIDDRPCNVIPTICPACEASPRCRWCGRLGDLVPNQDGDFMHAVCIREMTSCA